MPQPPMYYDTPTFDQVEAAGVDGTLRTVDEDPCDRPLEFLVDLHQPPGSHDIMWSRDRLPQIGPTAYVLAQLVIDASPERTRWTLQELGAACGVGVGIAERALHRLVRFGVANTNDDHTAWLIRRHNYPKAG